jgi:hypothetical protein
MAMLNNQMVSIYIYYDYMILLLDDYRNYVYIIYISVNFITTEPCSPEAWNHGFYREITLKWPNYSGEIW